MCPSCSHIGRIGAHGPAIVAACPIREVRVTDWRPYHVVVETPVRDYWTWSNAPLPVEIAPLKFRLTEHSSEAAALASLSDAMIAWARRIAFPAEVLA